MELLDTGSPAFTKAHLEQTQSHDYYSIRFQPCSSWASRDEVESRIFAGTRARASATEHAFQDYELSRDVRFEKNGIPQQHFVLDVKATTM